MIKKTLALIISMFMVISMVSPSTTKVYADTVEIKMVSVGMYHTALLKTDGSLWVWGENYDGELGNGTNIDSNKPIKIMDNVKFVAVGDKFTAVIKDDGSLWTFGSNEYGRLGIGTFDNNSYKPIKIMDNVKLVSAGSNHAAALKNDGSLWTWGYNGHWQLGYMTTGGFVNKPQKAMDNVKSVSVGGDNTAVIKTDNSLWTFGRNLEGQLGNGTRDYVDKPIKIMSDVKSVSVSSGHTAVIKNDGSLWTWGFNQNGQLGNGTFTSSYKPIKVMDNVAAVTNNSFETAAIKTDGSLWLWGGNSCNIIQDGRDGEAIKKPFKVMENIASVDIVASHHVVVGLDGSLWNWGENDGNQLGEDLGDGHTSTPIKVMEATNNAPSVAIMPLVSLDSNITVISAGVKMISAKWGHTALVGNDGSLWLWGYNENGEIGNDTEISNVVPVKVMSDVKYASAGEQNTAVIKTDGSVWTFGNNTRGQLGNGKIDKVNGFHYKPIKVMENAKTVVSGYKYTAAIKTDGSLWVWGGDGGLKYANSKYVNDKNYMKPVKIMDKVKSVDLGMNYMAVIKTDNSLWLWGANGAGQLGNGKIGGDWSNSSLVPVKIMDHVKAVSLGLRHTMAIKTDGSLWAWGDNYYGELGNGKSGLESGLDANLQLSPDSQSKKPIKIMDNVAIVSAGINHTQAIKTDGSLWAWGYNSYGQLGDGKNCFTEHKPVFVESKPVKIMDNVVGVAAANLFTIATKADGSVWSWGYNGRSGDGPLGNAGGYTTENNGFYPSPGQIISKDAIQTTPMATPVTVNVTVNGETKNFEVYKIFDQNYMKLSDLAYAVKDSKSHFSFSYDDKTKTITVTSGGQYTGTGGEATADGKSKVATPVMLAVYANGKLIHLPVYNIGGSAYFKLDDMTKLFNMGVKYDKSTQTIAIVTW